MIKGTKLLQIIVKGPFCNLLLSSWIYLTIDELLPALSNLRIQQQWPSLQS